MKYATDRPFADPDKAARKLIEIANSAEAYMDGRIPIEVINGPFLRSGGSPSEYGAGLLRRREIKMPPGRDHSVGRRH